MQILYYNNKPMLDSEYKEVIAQYNILKEPTAPYTPEQNKGSKHARALLTKKACLIHNTTNLPIDYWPEYYKTTSYLLNRIPTKQLN